MLVISEKSAIKLHPLERQVLDKLLMLKNRELSDSDLQLLRIQLRHAIILSREMTGHGFYTRFLAPEMCTRLPNHHSLWFGAVTTDLPGLNHGAGFQLYIKEGAINELEGFSYDEAWPDPWPGDYDDSHTFDVVEICHSGTPATSR